MPRVRRPGSATLWALAMSALLLIGALAWYVPPLRGGGEPAAEVVAPSGIPLDNTFTVPPHGQACMRSVTVTPRSDLAQFVVRPVAGAGPGGPPVALSLSAPGYHAHTPLATSYRPGVLVLAISLQPRRSLIATACFSNRGRQPLRLVGTTELRSLSRSYPVLIDGRPAGADNLVAGRRALGQISLSFYERGSQSLGSRLTQTIDHASNLTGGLLGAGLVWLLAAVTALGVPIAMIAAWRRALTPD